MPRCGGNPQWQIRVFTQLRDMQWHSVGDLFAAVEKDIPLHHAMRMALRLRNGKAGELPTNFEARWLLFRAKISRIGVETGPLIRSTGYQWDTKIRLRYVAGRVCEVCGGPVIKTGWTARVGVECLACAAVKPVVEPEPVVAQPSDEQRRAGRRNRRRGSRSAVREAARALIEIPVVEPNPPSVPCTASEPTTTRAPRQASEPLPEPVPPVEPISPVEPPPTVEPMPTIDIGAFVKPSIPPTPMSRPWIGASVQNGEVVLHARKHRHIAWYLKHMLGGSINAMEREMAKENNNVRRLLIKRGSSWNRFIGWIGQTYGWFKG